MDLAVHWGVVYRGGAGLGLGFPSRFPHGEPVLMHGQLILLLSFGTVELNEVGFKFVRKCINAVETKGELLAVALDYFVFSVIDETRLTFQ